MAGSDYTCTSLTVPLLRIIWGPMSKCWEAKQYPALPYSISQIFMIFHAIVYHSHSYTVTDFIVIVL